MRVKELEEVTDARNNKRKEYDDLRKQRLDEFMQGFSVITTKLKEMYQVYIFAFKHQFFSIVLTFLQGIGPRRQRKKLNMFKF